MQMCVYCDGCKPATLWNMVVWDMRVAMFAVRAAIWEWMYMRKVSEDQRPNFWIMATSTSASLRAMAPPARREWLLTCVVL